MPGTSRFGLVLAFAFVANIWTEGASAETQLCAFRSGPGGPCTCRVAGGAPGDFVTVSRGRCTKAARKKPAAMPERQAQQLDAVPAAKPGQAATTPDQPAAEPRDTGVAAPPPSAAATSRLETVRARGKLLCGVNTDLVGFSALAQTGEWRGLDADFCRAVAAAVFGDADKVEFVPVETGQRFEALKGGKIDLLARNTTWTMDRDVEMGLEFAGVLYFDGQGFMTGDERGLVSAQQLAGLKVCVETGTTTEQNMAYYFKAHNLQVDAQAYPNRKELLEAYTSGKCDAYSADRSALFSDRIRFTEPSKHAVLPEVISKEPLGPAVLQGDRAWAQIVRWTLNGLINAEEVGLDRAGASATGDLTDDARRLVEGAARSGEKLGLSKTWLRTVVASVGNYGEVFESNLGKQSPIGMDRGVNALWKRGGIQFAPPMW